MASSSVVEPIGELGADIEKILLDPRDLGGFTRVVVPAFEVNK